MRRRAERGVHRTTPLPTGELDGQYLVTEQVLRVTREELTRFALAGIRDGGHEGLVLWGGRQGDGVTAVTTVVRSHVEHSRGRVHVDERSFGRAARRIRKAGLVLVGQVHSHPGSDTRHSDGDDELIALPTDGLLSVVAPAYGTEFEAIGDASVHQFQDGRWVLCSSESVDDQITVAPGWIDARR